MRYGEIRCYDQINRTDPAQVRELAEEYKDEIYEW